MSKLVLAEYAKRVNMIRVKLFNKLDLWITFLPGEICLQVKKYRVLYLIIRGWGLRITENNLPER